ncbi:MAG: serine/threonine-protein kinase [Holophagae bacterium]|jgi:tetratricopeptide (TPR) repeat protein/tRNA A-37 threonylcarbamoyl transferase component Bud32
MRPETKSLLGQHVGHIRVLDLIGEGGMGAVYVGFDETLERRVALKAIRSEFRLNPLSKARFQREARILSQLDHPRICTIYDYVAGEDNDFLVMELVEGQSLRQAFAPGLDEEAKNSIAVQLLEVLVEVHGRGVIHRDLKPENIMVTPQGAIKVLDFGLSRSADEDTEFTRADTVQLGDSEKRGTDSRTQDPSYVKTRLGTILGTAGYMSPEQARGEAATPASDMYSSGLVLQEMFSGQRPFEEELSGEELVEKAARGETLPPTGLASDLTELINRLKSLAPGTRPSSVDALDQLQRIIDKPRRRRRRAMVAAVWAALLLLAAGMGLQSYRASREAQRANQEATRANQEAKAAEEVSDFLVGLFEASSPEEARGESFTALQILERGGERVSDELSDQPITQARMQATIARVYEQMGLYDEAVSLAERALETREEHLGREHVDVAASCAQLGDLKRNMGMNDEAEPLLERALQTREHLLRPDHPDVAKSLNLLAMLYEKSSRYGEAEPLYRRALEIQERELGPDHIDLAMSYTNLAILLARQDMLEEAKPLFERTLEIERQALGEDHPRVALAHMNLGILLKMQEKLDQAEPYYLRAIEIQEKVLGQEHPDLAATIQNLANLYLRQERFEDAESLYLRSLEMAEKALGPVHPDVGRTLGNLAQCRLEMGDLAEAEELYRRAIKNQEQAWGPVNHEVTTLKLNLANLLLEQRRYGEAEELYAVCVEVYREILEPEHPHFRDAIESYAGLLKTTGREEDAAAIEAEFG